MVWETSNYEMVIKTYPHIFVPGNRNVQICIVITECKTNIMILNIRIEGQ